MHELRLVAVSEDSTYLVLASTGRGTRFMLPVDDRLRAAVRGQFSRLGQYEIEVENPLRPKEIQARIRSGETAEGISEISGIPIERVRWFEGPVLQEREYIAQQAQNATVRTQGDAVPGATLEELVARRIGGHQLESGDASWDSWKREDRTWQVRLAFTHSGEERVAHWLYEPRHNSVTPCDEEAARFSAPASPPPPVALPEATVTPLSPRRPEAPVERPYTDHPTGPERPVGPAAPRNPPPATPLDEPSRPLSARRPDPAPAVPPRPEARPPSRPRTPREAEHSEPAAAAERERAARRPPEDTAPAAAPRRPGPETAPPPAEPPAPARPARRRRVGIDLGDTGMGHREVPEPPRPASPGDSAERTAPKRKGRGRRASVPSWDEIMFGAKKDD
ncbi:septation protein SepH [Nocardiopsis sp. CNT312]|uniref:septation protein SepH n=1 Tax=Nocardiopsis sp. CNT312 TaxID=1137268 RepID=UPI00048C6830|nr:septation protein SepH [Nocardiopsis sp. CNT312]